MHHMDKPFITKPTINKEEENLYTVEEVKYIINQVNNGETISIGDILEDINKGEINTRHIIEESMLTQTKYTVLIPDVEIIYLLEERYLINEHYARSLLENLD